MKSTQEEVVKKIYHTILKLKEGSVNVISNKSGISWHAANRALKLMEILDIVEEDKQKPHGQQRFYRIKPKMFSKVKLSTWTNKDRMKFHGE